MPIITGRDNVLSIYKEAAQNHWVLPCFCSENLTTTEAILCAVKEFGDEKGIENLPVIVAITCRYDHRTQAAFYTHTRRWDVGLRLFMADLHVLAGKDSPYGKLRIMIHLDHIQFDDDRELLSWDLGDFSSIMFDASKRPFDENIALTKQFVLDHGKEIVVEGACDEIVDATGTQRSEPTTPGNALRFFNETGADLIVGNLGTEHRASAKDLRYLGAQTRLIKELVGTRIVLHGASSVPGDQIKNLFNDGVCKVNLWTTLERDSSPDLLTAMVENASKVAGQVTVDELKGKGLLGDKCPADERASIDCFTTVYRQDIIFNRMKSIVDSYLRLWYT